MQLIPVIDIMGGVVVRAEKGDRARYRPLVSPLVSPLCRESDAVQVVDAFLRFHCFTVLYIADLDAILRRGNNLAVIAAIKARFPQLTLWIDSGIANDMALAEWMRQALGRPVIGTETLSDAAFVDRAIDCDPVLSLDYRGDAFIGPAELSVQPHRWPGDVIAMTLTRVGSGAGPDYFRLAELLQLAPDKAIYAAGGVRNLDDLIRLAGIGVAGALVASALHDGSIKQTDLANLATDGVNAPTAGLFNSGR